MAKDPAFLFYPGDYLKDTQCLSEKSQVAYDRIMCEHMRNICVTQEQLNFFTKRLSEEEKGEVIRLLTKISGGFQIEWVAESICKRKAYSESRRKNKEGKGKIISKSYDSHMENAIVNENEIINEAGNGNFLIPEMFARFKKVNPTYPGSIKRDYTPLFSIATFLHEQGKLPGKPETSSEAILPIWGRISEFIMADDFYRPQSLSSISNQIQTIVQKARNGKQQNGKEPTGGNVNVYSAYEKIKRMSGKNGTAGSKA